MPIQRCSCQLKETLLEFYTDVASSKESMNIGNAMLKFIDMINSTFKETQIWGMTSHYHLKLFPRNDCENNWLISVISSSNNEYYIEYRIPENRAPWKYAFITGVATSLKEARTYLAISMKESSGWIENSEVNNVLNENE